MCYLADNGHIHMGASSTRLGPICRKGQFYIYRMQLSCWLSQHLTPSMNTITQVTPWVAASTFPATTVQRWTLMKLLTSKYTTWQTSPLILVRSLILLMKRIGGWPHQMEWAARWWRYVGYNTTMLSSHNSIITIYWYFLQVYFTRNGINVGSREILLPKRGLYPVVAMKSKGDTVLVNLRPMTG